MEQPTSLVDIRRDSPHVLHILINKPPVNALNMDMVERLTVAFRSVDPDVRAVVFGALGDRAFCAGADVKEISERTPELSLQRSAQWRELFEAVRRCPVPVVAAVTAHAIGAGCVLSACCDIVVAAEEATFSLPEVRVGVLGGTRHTARIAPAAFVRYMALSGERIPAADMHRVGAIFKVVARGQVLLEAGAIATSLASRESRIVRLMKESMCLSEEMPTAEGYRVEQLFTTIAASITPTRQESA